MQGHLGEFVYVVVRVTVVGLKLQCHDQFNMSTFTTVHVYTHIVFAWMRVQVAADHFSDTTGAGVAGTAPPAQLPYQYNSGYVYRLQLITSVTLQLHLEQVLPGLHHLHSCHISTTVDTCTGCS